MKIQDVRVFIVNGGKAHALLLKQGAASEGGSWLSETVIANPMSNYPEYTDRRSSWLGMGGRVIVQIIADNGIEGLGESTGGMATASIIHEHIRRILIGKDPRDIEKLWDMMFKITLPYGRKGIPIMAVSAVDLALWDLVSKARSEPLYMSLGGATKDKVQAYVTGNESKLIKDRGYMGQKLAMPYGPSSGWEGMKRNAALVAETREILGPDMEIMLDCYMAWNVDYTIRMAELVAPYRVKWIEETLPPDDYAGYAEINRKVTSSAIATGEHEYTRYGYKQLIDCGAAQILQPDICWVGGVSEAKKICAMASAAHLPVIPHAGGLQPWALHLVFSQVNIPYAEFAYIHGADRTNFDPVFEGVQLPKDGWFGLPEEIGAGIRLREGALDLLDELK
ncbi:enolase C-terminal domain-like protein [Paenibacillus sacheonensis]|uniref:L-rhamnonate dehydratase n=1 Tax=Paenibacillus sacheonensis TaxID=742054 RepID=A0A7X4YSY4_9BACL|nr:enolase C-terminal domain-like protein [Paenibacillus sacheonensis]MBM7567734.1 L-rhamnonate dehydratase [Paenibacillus sacheonensis]NBC71992.1 L-rhamnonate dehydratase [Paenibacillus sacheonensis]